MAKPPEPTHPAQHPHAAPQHDQPPHELSQAEKDKDKEPLKPEDAEQLLRAGHRLRKKGGEPANWIAMTRHNNEMAVSFNATPERIKEVLSQELILATEP